MLNGSIEEPAKALERIILDRNLRRFISKRGIETAYKIDEDSVVVELVNTIKEIAKMKERSYSPNL